MARRKLTAKQIAAGFGGKRRQAARKARKSSKRASRRKSPARKFRTVRNMARRKKGRGRRGFNGWKLANTIANVNMAAQLVEPVARSALPAAMSGDVAGALAGAKQGAKEAVSFRNLLEAFGPKLGVKVARKVSGMVGRF